MRSIGTPVRSAAIMAHVVSCPCPSGVAPLRTRTRPPSSSSTDPNSLAGAPAVISTYTAIPMPNAIGSSRGAPASLLGSKLVVTRGGEHTFEGLG